MARRRHSRNNKDGGLILQLIVCIFLPIVLLLSSKNPILKGLGAILLFLLFIGYTVSSSGLSSEETALFVIFIVIIGIAILLFIANRSSNNENSENADKSDRGSHTYANGTTIKTATLKKSNAAAPPATLPKIQAARPFDELFTATEKEIESVVGPRTTQPVKKEVKSEISKFQNTKAEDSASVVPNKTSVDRKAYNGSDGVPVSAKNTETKKTSAENKTFEAKTKPGAPVESVFPEIRQSKVSDESRVDLVGKGSGSVEKIEKEPVSVSVATINKEPVPSKGPVLPKIVMPEPRKEHIKSEVNVPVCIDPSFMNPPVGDAEDKKVERIEPVVIKDEFYFDSVAEAVAVYQVPENHKKIMIHKMENTDISECPALIWKEQDHIKILPLLRSARIYQWPLKCFPSIIGERRYDPDYDNEYVKISNADIGKEFSDLFPEYPYGRAGVYTDLFTLPVGVSVTNTSARALFKLLNAELLVEDVVTKSDQYVPAVKEIYRKHFLYENHVISLEEYNLMKEDIIGEYMETERSDSVYRTQIKHIQRLEL